MIFTTDISFLGIALTKQEVFNKEWLFSPTFILIFDFYVLKKIRLDFSCESSRFIFSEKKW